MAATLPTRPCRVCPPPPSFLIRRSTCLACAFRARFAFGAGGAAQFGGDAIPHDGAGQGFDLPLQEARHFFLLPTETLALCTDGWLEAGPVASHQGPDSFAEMTQALSGLELEELTERLGADAVGRSSGTLRDDLVVLAVRPRGDSEVAEAPRELAAEAG